MILGGDLPVLRPNNTATERCVGIPTGNTATGCLSRHVRSTNIMSLRDNLPTGCLSRHVRSTNILSLTGQYYRERGALVLATSCPYGTILEREGHSFYQHLVATGQYYRERGGHSFYQHIVPDGTITILCRYEKNKRRESNASPSFLSITSGDKSPCSWSLLRVS